VSLAAFVVQPRRAVVGFAGNRVLLRGVVVCYLSIFILLPLAAVIWQSTGGGWTLFRETVTAPDSVASLELTLFSAVGVSLVNAVAGTVIAWVLVRDRFAGKRVLDSVIDLPFALPTIVAGLTLLTLYGPQSPIGLNVAYTRAAIFLSLLFVSLPFVTRAVQPVLLEIDTDMEAAAASLGARGITIFRRIVLPNLLPAILSGIGLGFARAMGEFGAVVLISGNIPFKTEVASVHIYSQIESDNVAGAAALSVVLLVVSLLTLLLITAVQYWGRRYDR
jgi:sulfate/thiosulfate transport system permease protein